MSDEQVPSEEKVSPEAKHRALTVTNDSLARVNASQVVAKYLPPIMALVVSPQEGEYVPPVTIINRHQSDLRIACQDILIDALPEYKIHFEAQRARAIVVDPKTGVAVHQRAVPLAADDMTPSAIVEGFFGATRKQVKDINAALAAVTAQAEQNQHDDLDRASRQEARALSEKATALLPTDTASLRALCSVLSKDPTTKPWMLGVVSIAYHDAVRVDVQQVLFAMNDSDKKVHALCRACPRPLGHLTYVVDEDRDVSPFCSTACERKFQHDLDAFLGKPTMREDYRCKCKRLGSHSDDCRYESNLEDWRRYNDRAETEEARTFSMWNLADKMQCRVCAHFFEQPPGASDPATIYRVCSWACLAWYIYLDGAVDHDLNLADFKPDAAYWALHARVDPPMESGRAAFKTAKAQTTAAADELSREQVATLALIPEDGSTVDTSTLSKRLGLSRQGLTKRLLALEVRRLIEREQRPGKADLVRRRGGDN